MDREAKVRAMEQATNVLVAQLCDGRRVERFRAVALCLQIEAQRIKMYEEAKGNPLFTELYKVVKSQKSFVEAQQALDGLFPGLDEYG